MTPREAVQHLLDEEFLFIDPQIYLDKYDFTPAYTDGKIVGYMMHRGGEVHLLACPGGKMTRRHIRELLVPYFKRYGTLWTSVRKDSPDSFVKRMGFKQTGGDGVFNFYRLDEVRHA